MIFDFSHKRAFALIAILFLSIQFLFASETKQSHINNGILDLRDWNAEQFSAVELSGNWEFYWNKLLSPSDFPLSNKPEFLPFPEIWNNLNSKHGELSNFGYASYRLTILLPNECPLLALQFPDVYSSSKLWIDDKLFMVAGETGKSKEKSTPYWLPQTKSFKPNGNKIVLVLQISNFDHNKGGISIAPVIGNNTALFQERDQNSAIDLLLTGALIMGGLFLFGLFVFGRQQKSVLYFALFCIVYSYRIIGTDLYFLHNLIPNVSWQITIRLEYVSLYLSTFLFITFIKSLYPHETSNTLGTILKSITLGLTALTIFTPASIFTWPISYFLIVLVLYFFYATSIFVRAS